MLKGAGDFNGDGYADILWQNDNGQAVIWTYERDQPGERGGGGQQPGFIHGM